MRETTVRQVFEHYVNHDIAVAYIEDCTGLTHSFLEEEFTDLVKYMGYMSVYDYELDYNVLTIRLGPHYRKYG